jgi:hypothetical protein
MRPLVLALALSLLIPVSQPVHAAEEVEVSAPAPKAPRKLNRKAVKIEDNVEEIEESELPRSAPARQYEESNYTVGRSSRMQVGLELLGSALLYSFQGSALVTDQIAINAGLAYFSASAGAGSTETSASLFLVPVSASYLFGGPAHHFEVLGGVLGVFASAEVKGDGIADRASGRNIVPQIGAGYRYWPTEGGFHFRATLYGLFLPNAFGVWPGFSFGYAF